MINKSDFEAMRKEMSSFDELREKIIIRSRKVLQLSKACIYNLHRQDSQQAKKEIEQAKKEIEDIRSLVKKDEKASDIGAFHEATEEFAEAYCYYSWLTNKTLPTRKDLGVETEAYLAGLSDLLGELVRKAINDGIKGNFKSAEEIKDFASEIYAELMLFDFKNGNLRKKFDSIKYSIEKLEDTVFNLKLKDKL